MSNFDQKNQKVNTQFNADKINIDLKPITCPNCQNGNPAKAKFCSECGTSLVFKCPICNSETPISGKFCSGCGKEIGRIFADIEEAKRRRGGQERELVHKYRLKIPINPLNPIDLIESVTKHWETIRTTLDIDEYVARKQDNVSYHKGKSYEKTAEGCLYITNKRLIFLGNDPSSPFGRTYYEILIPLNEISEVSYRVEKLLFLSAPYAQIIWKGNLRMFGFLSDSETKSWVESIEMRLHGKTVATSPFEADNLTLLKCPNCGLPFKNQESLDAHVKNWHK